MATFNLVVIIIMTQPPSCHRICLVRPRFVAKEHKNQKRDGIAINAVTMGPGSKLLSCSAAGPGRGTPRGRNGAANTCPAVAQPGPNQVAGGPMERDQDSFYQPGGGRAVPCTMGCLPMPPPPPPGGVGFGDPGDCHPNETSLQIATFGPGGFGARG